MRELMRRRYVYGESKPYDAEVEYVQTSGQQIIRINCPPVISTDVVFKFVNDTIQQRLYCTGTSIQGLLILIGIFVLRQMQIGLQPYQGLHGQPNLV